MFSEKLRNYEAKVDPQLWANISSQIGAPASAAAGGTGLSILTKTIIGAAIIGGAVLTTVYVMTPGEEDTKPVVIEHQAAVDNQDEPTQGIKKENTQDVAFTDNYTAEEQKGTDTETIEFPLDIYTEHLASDDDPLNEVDFDDSLLPDTPMNNQSGEEVDSEASSSEESANSEETGKAEETNSHKEESNQEDREEEQETRTVITFKLPNIFNPGGSFNPYLTLDGANIENEVSLDELEDLQVVVLDSYSKVVFRSSDPYLKWDGTAMNGSPLPEGTYIIYLTATTKDKIPVNGSSQLYIQR